MRNTLLSGFWRYLLNIPPGLWERQVAKAGGRIEAGLADLSALDRQVHHHVVEALPKAGKPLSPSWIGERMGLPAALVCGALERLEKRMTFLFRNPHGEVTWAYPVTVEPTPHRVIFDSGETIFAAWAVDAFATPFVQGRLRNTTLSVAIETACAASGRPMRLVIDSELRCSTSEAGTDPIVFVPEVDFYALQAPNIIEAFWKESVFFRSEEQARAYRRKVHRIRGAYFNTRQVAYLTRIVQSAVFGFGGQGR